MPATARSSTTDPNGATTRFGYDLDNNLTSVTDPVNNTTTYTYDARNRLVQENTSGQSVYANDFEGAVGPEWSNTSVDTTPSGRKFLGQFGNDTVRLALSGLPAHASLTISFDLYIIRTWDGNGPVGPDGCKLSVANGPILLDTTFSNVPGKNQAYRDAYPGGSHPGETGAVEVNTLGFQYPGRPDDAVYHLSFTITHTSDAVEFDFAGCGPPGAGR